MGDWRMKKIKEITGEELDALVKEGRDILHAIIVQDKYTPRSTAEEEIRKAMAQCRKPIMKKVWKPSEEERKRLSNIDITRAYQLWYSKAFVVVYQSLPWRADDFRSLYEFPSKNRSELTAFNYRVADLLRGFGLPNGANWGICYSLIKAQCDILESVQAFMDPSQASAQSVSQDVVPDITPQEFISVPETGSVSSREKKRGMDDREKRSKRIVAAHMENFRKLADMQKRLDKGEDVSREEVGNLLRSMF